MKKKQIEISQKPKRSVQHINTLVLLEEKIEQTKESHIAQTKITYRLQRVIRSHSISLSHLHIPYPLPQWFPGS